VNYILKYSTTTFLRIAGRKEKTISKAYQSSMCFGGDLDMMYAQVYNGAEISICPHSEAHHRI
jgi:hypothetical protein